MEERLKQLIESYHEAVKSACGVLFLDLKIDAPTSNMEWVGNGIEQKGNLRDGWSYYKHGYGCKVRHPNGVVDFDFGESGQIDGFDLFRLWDFYESSDLNFVFEDESELKVIFEKSIESKEITYSGYILYYLETNTEQAAS